MGGIGFFLFFYKGGCMTNKNDILLSTLEMLDERYNEKHNVTISSVVEKHLKNTFQMRRYLCRRTAKSICTLLEQNNIFLPYEIDGGAIKKTWAIDLGKLNKYMAEKK